MAQERLAERKSEYFQGEVFAMAGASPRHVWIVANIVAEFRQQLKGKPCRVSASDLRLRVTPGGLYTYPDVMVVCGEPKFVDDGTDTIMNPKVVIEVLSPSTEQYDRGHKAQQYRTIDSLQELALVSQYGPGVEVFRRHELGTWLLTDFTGFDAICKFESLDCEIPLAAIYKDVKFEKRPYPLPTEVRP